MSGESFSESTVNRKAYTRANANTNIPPFVALNLPNQALVATKSEQTKNHTTPKDIFRWWKKENLLIIITNWNVITEWYTTIKEISVHK